MDILSSETKQNPLSQSPDKQEEGLLSSELLSKKITRREAIQKLLLIAAGATLVGAGCTPEKSSAVEKKNSTLDQQTNELNTQFQNESEKYLNPDGSFNYERYTKQYTEFPRYIQHIETHAPDIEGQYGINPNIMKALSSSIICSHIGNWEKTNVNKDILNQRIGPMQFYPSNVLPTIEQSFNITISIDEATLEQNNIYFGMISLAESLKEIKNDGQNKNLLDLMLADYYGGSSLVGLVKNNQEIDENHYLRSNYNLYKRALNILNGQNLVAKEVETEPSVKEVWEKTLTLWPDSKFKGQQAEYQKQIEKYQGSFELTDAQLLSLFLSVAMTESGGGQELYNPSTGARGWYQLIPEAKHLEHYKEELARNGEEIPNWTYNDVQNNSSVSIAVGVWALMRYHHSMDLHKSLGFFKAGGYQDEDTKEYITNMGMYSDDRPWWNNVSKYSQQLMGSDTLAMGSW